MTVYAQACNKQAPLYSDFARPFLERHFSPDVVAALYGLLPTYKSGPRKGLIKGYVHWKKVARGGWHHDGPRSGVIYPGTHGVHVVLDGRTILDETANATDAGRIEAMTRLIGGTR